MKKNKMFKATDVSALSSMLVLSTLGASSAQAATSPLVKKDFKDIGKHKRDN